MSLSQQPLGRSVVNTRPTRFGDALVRRESVVTRDGKPTVFLVREGKAQVRALVLGTERQGQVIVKEGLSGGETLVLRPKDDLKDGAPVKVKSGA